MRYTTALRRQGLTQLDVKILTVLNESDALGSYVVFKRLKSEKRTTVDYRIKRLCKLGWVLAKINGSRQRFSLSESGRSLFAESKKSSQVVLFEDVIFLQKELIHDLQGPSRSRVFFIEPLNSKSLLLNTDYDFEKLQSALIKSHRIAEGVIANGVCSFLSQRQWSILKNRLFEMYVVSDELLQFDDMVWFIDGKTYLLNPVANQYRMIDDLAFFKSMISLMRSLKLHGKKLKYRN